MSSTPSRPLGILKSWSLKNFKAVGTGKVAFPGLTVLLGANSSGKSSLIQSILSAVQVVQGNFGNRFPFSGDLTRLGDIGQVSHIGNGSFELAAGFEHGELMIQVAQDELGRYLAPGEMIWEIAEARASKIALDWEVAIGRKSVSRRFEIEVIDLDEDSQLDHRIGMGLVSRKDLPLSRYRLSGHFECFGSCADPQPLTGHELSGKNTLRWKPSSPTFRLGAGFENLSFSNFDEVLQRALWSVSGGPEVSDLQTVLEEIRAARDVTDENLCAVLDEIRVFFSRELAAERADTTDGLFELLSSKDRISLWRLVNILEEYLEASLPDQALALIDEIVATHRWVHWSSDMPSCWGNWHQKFNQILESIPDSIAYLGPLRLDPQTLQSPNGATNPCIPVGRIGENATHRIWQSERDKTFKPFPTADGKGSESLTGAISSWLDYLELGSSVTFKNMGNAGFETLVDGLPLYNLGTGVSQMLPLLALCLSDQGERVVLIEQPELHLHPSSQQKFADFLIAMVESGRRLVVETHSEYLVTRLRRRAAVEGLEANDYRLVFVERQNGSSTFRASKLHDSGQVSYWPDGFFGQVEEDVLAILEADVRKGQGKL